MKQKQIVLISLIGFFILLGEVVLGISLKKAESIFGFEPPEISNTPIGTTSTNTGGFTLGGGYWDFYETGIVSSSLKSDTEATSTFRQSLYLGSGTVNQPNQSDGSLYVTGNLEVDGTARFDGLINLIGNDVKIAGFFRFNDNLNLQMGSNGDVKMQYDETQTPDTLLLGLSADSNNLIILEQADMATDFAHILQHDPTIFIQSSSTANTALFGEFDYNKLQLSNYDATATTTYAGGATADPCGTGTGIYPSSTMFFSHGGFPCYCSGAGADLKVVDDSACTY